VLIVERLLQRWFRQRNLLGVKEFYDPHLMPVASDLEDSFLDIKREYEEIIKRYDDFAPFQSISPHQTYISNDDRWRLFFLRGAGIWFKRNCALMPVTHDILKRHPYVVSAYVSVLGPRKRLNPHAGPYSGVLRLHLALDIPNEDRCHITVNGQRRRWKQGKCLLFDDTFEHWAANDTDELRSVLFIDVLRPLPRGLALVNIAIVKAAWLFPYIFIPMWRHKRWEKKFYQR
jgi:aspartyl/asparaginyl beta-hydroxylase (cupin superfamily)